MTDPDDIANGYRKAGGNEYCCERFREEKEECGKIYFDAEKKIWNIQEFDNEYFDWYDIIEDIKYCPFCGKKLK